MSRLSLYIIVEIITNIQFPSAFTKPPHLLYVRICWHNIPPFHFPFSLPSLPSSPAPQLPISHLILYIMYVTDAVVISKIVIARWIWLTSWLPEDLGSFYADVILHWLGTNIPTPSRPVHNKNALGNVIAKGYSRQFPHLGSRLLQSSNEAAISSAN